MDHHVDADDRALEETMPLHISDGEFRLKPRVCICLFPFYLLYSYFSSNGLRSIHVKKPLRMIAASCYMPKRKRRLGEDAHFICEEEQVVGVADGVGGWTKHGIDAGEYARELMSHAERAVREASKGSVDLQEVLKIAYSKTQALGSSTACIVALKDQCIHSVNLGDSGFAVIRDDKVLYHSPIQQHMFNYPFQLGKSCGDKPCSAEVKILAAEPGDIIVAGTDGLFDNMFDHELARIVKDNGIGHCLKPQGLAHIIAKRAHQISRSKTHETPFSIGSRYAGETHTGGKRDDITVVLMCITDCDT